MRRGPVRLAEGCESSSKPGTSRPQKNGSSKIQDGYPSEINEHSRRGHKVGQRCVLRRGRGIGRSLWISRTRIFTLPLIQDTRLRFAYEGEIFELQVLPFGLSTAPKTFTPLVRAIGAYLKTFGINIFLYLDDWLAVVETHQLALSYRDTVCMITQRVGFLINEDKSNWTPTQFPMFLGSILS